MPTDIDHDDLTDALEATGAAITAADHAAAAEAERAAVEQWPAEVRAAARLLGAAPGEVIAVSHTADGDLSVTTHDGLTSLIVDPARPDGAGQHGILAAAPTTSPMTNRHLRVFVPRPGSGEAPVVPPEPIVDLVEADPDDDLPPGTWMTNSMPAVAFRPVARQVWADDPQVAAAEAELADAKARGGNPEEVEVLGDLVRRRRHQAFARWCDDNGPWIDPADVKMYAGLYRFLRDVTATGDYLARVDALRRHREADPTLPMVDVTNDAALARELDAAQAWLRDNAPDRLAALDAEATP